MSDTHPGPDKLRISPFTLLATTALAVSNLIVGLLQNNTFLVLASAVISAAFAAVYAHRSGMVRILPGPKNSASAVAPEGSEIAKPSTSKHFPLWLFLAVIFILMPAILLFLQTLEQ